MPTDAVSDEAIQKVWMEYAEIQNQQPSNVHHTNDEQAYDERRIRYRINHS